MKKTAWCRLQIKHKKPWSLHSGHGSKKHIIYFYFIKK